MPSAVLNSAGFGLTAPAPQCEADRARAFRGKVKSPRSCHREAGNFRDDCTELPVAKGFFEAGRVTSFSSPAST